MKVLSWAIKGRTRRECFRGKI